jgi:hypothetical protein
MFWGCITYQGVGTFTEVEGNINSRMYINILDTYLWPVIARHFLTDGLFESTITCVASLSIALFQSLFKVHLNFDLHQCTRRCLFSVRMVLRIFLLVNPWNRNRLRTLLVEIVFGKTLFTSFGLRTDIAAYIGVDQNLDGL